MSRQKKPSYAEKVTGETFLDHNDQLRLLELLRVEGEGRAVEILNWTGSVLKRASYGQAISPEAQREISRKLAQWEASKKVEVAP